MESRRFLAVLLFAALCIPAFYASPSPASPRYTPQIDFGVYDYLPPCPTEQTFIQPDGTDFEGAVRGMEIGGGIETIDGHVAVQDSKGWWTYSTSKENGVSLASSARVGIDSPPAVLASGGGADSKWVGTDGNDTRDGLFESFGAANNANAVVKYVVIMVDFATTGVDDRFLPGHDATYFKNMLSGNGTNPTGTMTEYYYENSYGAFTPIFDVYGPYRVSGSHASYAPTSSLFMTRALAIADPVINFATYNYNFVIFIHAGPDQSATANPSHIWSFATTLNYVTADGVTIGSGCCGPEINAQIGVFCHEMGHTLGCPDYYDTTYVTHGTGEWDLMGSSCWLGSPQGSNPGHFNPYSKQVTMGWMAPTVLSATTLGATLRQYEKYPDALRITISAAESFFFTYVNKSCAMFDRYLHGSGLLIWHYDSVGSQANKNRMRLAVEEWDYLDGTQEIRLALNRGEPTDPFQNDTTGMSGLTMPSTYLGTGVASGWTWCNISGCGATMKLDLLKPGTAREFSANFPKVSGTPPLIEGTSVTVSSEIFNTGGTSATGVTVDFYDGEPGNGGTKIGLSQTVNLAANSKITASVPWTAQPTGSHMIYVVVDPTNTFGETDEGNNVQKSMIRVWPRNAPILIVDDDMNYEFQAAYESALTALGYPYVMVSGTAPLALMQKYEILIWFTGGNRQSGALNTTEIANLKTYLAGGKCAWFLSNRLASALGDPGTTLPGVDPVFLRDYLGATYNRTYYAGASWANGTGDEIGGTNSFGISIPLGRAFSDSMGVYTGATSSMASSYEKQYAVKKNGGAWKTVFFGFDLSQVTGIANQTLLTQRVLDWFKQSTISIQQDTYPVESTAQITVHDTDLSGSVTVKIVSPSEPAGENVICTQVSPGTFTGTITLSATDAAGVLHVAAGEKLNATYNDAAPVMLRYDWAYVAAPTAAYFKIPVVAGWNFVSRPLTPAGTALPAALADSSGDTVWTRAMWYDPLGGNDKWKQYNAAWGAALNDLQNVDVKMGVWIYVTTVGDGFLNVSGSVPASTAIQLRAGWNMVGFPSASTTYTVAMLQAQCPSVTIVEQFNGANPPYLLSSISGAATLAQGRGYWLYTASDAVWTVNW
jgi:M6 family metalloprotease-like protein